MHAQLVTGGWGSRGRRVGTVPSLLLLTFMGYEATAFQGQSNVLLSKGISSATARYGLRPFKSCLHTTCKEGSQIIVRFSSCSLSSTFLCCDCPLSSSLLKLAHLVMQIAENYLQGLQPACSQWHVCNLNQCDGGLSGFEPFDNAEVLATRKEQWARKDEGGELRLGAVHRRSV